MPNTAIDLKTLPEPQFITVDWNAQYRELVAAYEQIVGAPLSKGQVESLIFAAFAYRENLLRININETAKQNLLAYARGEVLDHLGALVGVSRLSAAAAITTLRFTFEEELPTELLIPQGTRVQSKDGKVTFVTDKDLNVLSGSLSADIAATCAEAGEIGSGYTDGTITELVDPLPYVQDVENISVTYGGSDIESDDHMRLRIRMAIESFSTAGPEGAYRYWAETAHQDIVDVAVWSPEPGVVKVAPLLKGGELPDQEMLDLVYAVLNDEKVRPLTDNVVVESPVAVPFSIVVQIYIYKSASMLYDTIVKQANDTLGSYAGALKERLGVDIVPEQIVGVLQKITGVYRVALMEPAYAELEINEVAICGEINVVIAGSVDG